MKTETDDIILDVFKPLATHGKYYTKDEDKTILIAKNTTPQDIQTGGRIFLRIRKTKNKSKTKSKSKQYSRKR